MYLLGSKKNNQVCSHRFQPSLSERRKKSAQLPIPVCTYKERELPRRFYPALGKMFSNIGPAKDAKQAFNTRDTVISAFYEMINVPV